MMVNQRHPDQRDPATLASEAPLPESCLFGLEPTHHVSHGRAIHDPTNARPASGIRAFALRCSTCLGRPSIVRRTSSICRPWSTVINKLRSCIRCRSACSLTTRRSLPAVFWAML